MPRSLRHRGWQKPPILCCALPDSALGLRRGQHRLRFRTSRVLLQANLAESMRLGKRKARFEIVQPTFALKSKREKLRVVPTCGIVVML